MNSGEKDIYLFNSHIKINKHNELYIIKLLITMLFVQNNVILVTTYSYLLEKTHLAILYT